MIGSRNNDIIRVTVSSLFRAFDGVQNGKFYSRDGQFNIDNEGMLVNTAGLQVQGYVADQDGNSSTLSVLRFIDGCSIKQPTDCHWRELVAAAEQ